MHKALLLKYNSKLEEILSCGFSTQFRGLMQLYYNGLFPNKPLTRCIHGLLEDRAWGSFNVYVYVYVCVDVYVYVYLKHALGTSVMRASGHPAAQRCLCLCLCLCLRLLLFIKLP